MTLKARHIPGWLNVVALQAIQARPDQTVSPSRVPLDIYKRLYQPQVDLFATRFNKLLQFVSPVPDSLAWPVRALSLPWEDLDSYAFPPVAILGILVAKLRTIHAGES